MGGWGPDWSKIGLYIQNIQISEIFKNVFEQQQQKLGLSWVGCYYDPILFFSGVKMFFFVYI